MINHIKQHPIQFHLALVLALSLLFSTVSNGQGEVDMTQPVSVQGDVNSPPVAQALVPEGVFATQLAEALQLGASQDEAKAEELLSHLGIEPKNGWLAEYPVTPEVLGDIEKDMSVASDQGKVTLTKDQALRLFNEVKAKLGFDVNLAPSVLSPELVKKTAITKIYSYTDDKGTINLTDDFNSIPKAYQKSAKLVSQSTPHELSNDTRSGVVDETVYQQHLANPDPEVINHYYYEQGPPLVTYYSPPDPYSYLYSWVPYPFWSTGFYFTGFYVLNNFRRQVFFNSQPYFVAHHGGRSSFSQPLSVGPVNTSLPGQLSTSSQEHTHWFSTPNAQASARAIVTLNQNPSHFNNTVGTNRPQMNLSRPSVTSVGNFKTFNNPPPGLNTRMMRPNNSFRAAPPFGGRVLNQPAFNQRSFVPINPRFYTPPVNTFSQNFNAIPHSVNGGIAHEFHNNGGSPGFHGGGAFSGGARGGHR